MNLRVVNVCRQGSLNEPWCLRLKELIEKITKSSDRLAANYQWNNLDLEGHLTFDLLVDQHDQIVSFSGIYNGGRYPDGVYRILNRTWLDERYRVSHTGFPFITSKYILASQLQEYKEQLKMVFVSRESPKGRFFLKRWAASRPSDEQWKVSEKMIQVVPDVFKQQCFQYICFRELQKTDWSFNSIDEAEWAKLPN